VQSRTRDIAVIAVGAGLLLLSVYAGGHLLVGTSIPLFVLCVMLYGAGAYAMVRYGFPRWARAARTSWVEARFRGTWWSRSAEDDRLAGLPDAARAQFIADVQERVDHWFEENRRPTNARTVSTWMQESTGIRPTLAREFVEQYGWRVLLPRVEALDWLFRWHADALFAKWEQGKLRDDRALADVPTELRVGSVLGPVALGRSSANWSRAVAPWAGGQGRSAKENSGAATTWWTGRPCFARTVRGRSIRSHRDFSAGRVEMTNPA
jgi:hypothetical protein